MGNKNSNYMDLAFWIDLLFKKGVLIVAELFGVLFLLRALGSPEFNVEAAVLGAGLVVVGVVFEYLVWIRKTSFLAERIKVLEEKSKKLDDRIIELTQKVVQTAPAGSAGGKEG